MSASRAPIAISGPRTQRLQRRDRSVAPEHGHEPGHAGGEERAAVLARPHAQGGEVGDRAVERAAQALPATTNTRHAERPRRDDVADRLALVVELLDGGEIVLDPRQDVDVEVPVLVRLERDGEGHRTRVEPTRLREDDVRAEVSTRVDDREPATRLVEGGRRRRGQRLRELRVSEREVVLFHRDDVREIRLRLEHELEVEPVDGLVAQRDLFLHPGAHEPLPRDRDGVAGEAVRRPVAEVERRLEVLDTARREKQRRRPCDPHHEP